MFAKGYIACLYYRTAHNAKAYGYTILHEVGLRSRFTCIVLLDAICCIGRWLHSCTVDKDSEKVCQS